MIRINAFSLANFHVIALLIVLADSAAAQTGDLKINFKIRTNAPVPQLKAQFAGGNFFCAAANVKDESFLVDPKTKAIQNIVVYVYAGRRGTKLPDQPQRKKLLTLANRNCRFDPHILLTQVGDTIEVTNPDPIGHNANFGFISNQQLASMVPIGGSVKVRLTDAEPAVIPVACNIHPWMKAHVLVVEHPFAALSDKNGDLIIKNIPAGGEVIFRAWHEIGSFKNKIYINGKQEKWASNKFKVVIKPGLNDLGTVEIPITEFNLPPPVAAN